MTDGTPQGIERRLVLRLLARWRQAAASSGAGMPSLSDLSEQDLADVGANMFLLKVSSETEEPTVVRLGQLLRDDASGDFTGRPVSAIPEDTLAGNGLSFYPKVLENRVPISLGGEYADRDGNRVLYRSVILPLAPAGGRVGHLLGAVNGKIADGGT